MCPNRRHVYKSTIVFKFVVESRLEEACRARPRQTDATDGSNLHPLGTNLHRSFAPSHCFARGLASYCGLLRAAARESAGLERMQAPHWRSVPNVSGRAPGCKWACSKGRIVASNTSTTHKNTLLHREMVVFSHCNTLSASSSWHACAARPPAMAQLVDSHLRLAWNGGEVQRATVNIRTQNANLRFPPCFPIFLFPNYTVPFAHLLDPLKRNLFDHSPHTHQTLTP